MDDRPRRQEQDGRLAGAVHLVVQPNAVALKVTGGVGIARACLLARFGHGRASNTRLNGVSATRRNRVKPPAVTTSRILASPACAPSASPTSWESDAGVQSSVENE